MLLVALTGGIATGKSVVAQVWEQLGCYIDESDKLAHQLQSPNQPAWKAIVEHFGERILNPDKTINRRALGEIVFSDKNERDFINSVLHPLVIKKKRELVRELETKGTHKIYVSVAALTIEAGFRDFFDKIVVVHCAKEIQIMRLMERDSIEHDMALEKISSQMPAEEKLKFADYIIDTTGALRETLENAEQVYRNLVIDHEIKSLDGA